MTITYRENYGLFTCAGILYNHESPRRNPNFVTRKITQAAARIKMNMERGLRLGNLDARRDWGFAGDYIQAMWSMLPQELPDDYVIATGVTHSVRDLCKEAFVHVGLDYGDYVTLEAENFRPPEAAQLVGNPSKANRILGWKPNVTFRGHIRMMVDADPEFKKSFSHRGDTMVEMSFTSSASIRLRSRFS
jgi:GDPmannose 4,6-dehydratase